MVAETKESMTQMFDTIADTARVSMEAGRRMQESWFDAIGGEKTNPTFDAYFGQGEKVAKEFFPFVGKNMHTAAESFNTCMQAGMDVFRGACDMTMKGGEGDFYRKSHDLFDAGFNALRTNFNAINKAGRRVMENWATFCQSTISDTAASKPAQKPTK